MIDFSRLVSYLYIYEQDNKGKCVGHAKVMVPVTGGNAEIRAEIKGVYENVPVDYRAYALSH